MVASSYRRALIALIVPMLPVGAQAAPFGCPAIKPIPRAMVIGTRYAVGDSSYSLVDSAAEARERAARQPISAAVSVIARLADRWSTSTDQDKPKVAACIQAHLLAHAKAQAMMEASSRYDAFYREWMIGSLAISYLKAERGLATRQGARIVRAWLRASGREIAADNKRWLAQGENNNHRYWGGVAAMASGLATDDAQLVNVGRQMRAAGLNAVALDGTLNAELSRRALALHYHLFAASALAALIALDPSPTPAEQQSAMLRLARLITREASDRSNSVLEKRTGVIQVPENHPALFYLIKPWANNLIIARLIASTRPSYQFLGGDLGWLIARLPPLYSK